MMRTTLTLNDRAFDLASAYANARELKLGAAVSELIIKANVAAVGPEKPAARKPKRVGQTWVFDLPAHAPPLTSQKVKALTEDPA